MGAWTFGSKSLALYLPRGTDTSYYTALEYSGTETTLLRKKKKKIIYDSIDLQENTYPVQNTCSLHAY